MNNRGFILAETIVMSVVLLVAFSFIYMAANNYINREKTSIFYDDVASIYQGYYVKEALSNYANLANRTYIQGLLSNSYGRIIGTETAGLFYDAGTFGVIADHLNLYQIYITNDVYNLKRCARNIALSDTKCQNTFMDEELRAYIMTINITDLSNEYYLILTFRRDNHGNTCLYESCFSHYIWVAI